MGGDSTATKPVAQVTTNTGIYRNNSGGMSKILPKISWNDYSTRLEHFATYYWHDSKLRSKVAYEQNIKPEVLICIARADSHLWHALKSKNNVGNVWNNDRWDTVAYKTLEAGIRAMGTHALNGTYLSHKQSIGSLSPWGWGSKPYYATSESTWNANVLNCLTLIHGKKINEDFMFRIR